MRRGEEEYEVAQFNCQGATEETMLIAIRPLSNKQTDRQGKCQKRNVTYLVSPQNHSVSLQAQRLPWDAACMPLKVR